MEDLFSFYGLTTFLVGLVWAVIYSLRPDLRREQLILGILGALLVPLYFIADLHDAVTVSLAFDSLSAVDLVFAFFISGVAGTIFHAIFGKFYHHLPRREKLPPTKQKKLAQLWIARLFLMWLLFLWGVLFMTVALEIPVPQAVLVGSIIFMLYIVSHHHDLFVDAVWGSFLTTFIVFVAGTIAVYTVGADSNISLVRGPYLALGVPLDLLFYSAALGVATGPIYECVRNLKLN